MKARVTTSKYGGDDRYSWAVFVDGRPVVTGLDRDEAQYHKGIIVKQLAEAEDRARQAQARIDYGPEGRNFPWR